MRSKAFFACLLCMTAAANGAELSAASKQARAGEPEFRELYKELIETNTTLSVGSCTNAANQIKARLLKAGYPESACI